MYKCNHLVGLNHSYEREVSYSESEIEACITSINLIFLIAKKKKEEKFFSKLRILNHIR